MLVRLPRTSHSLQYGLIDQYSFLPHSSCRAETRMGASASALTVSAVPGIKWSIVSMDADLRIRLMRFAPTTMATLLEEAKNSLRAYRRTEWLNVDTLEIVVYESLDELDRSRLSLALTRTLAHAEYSARLSLRISGTDCCVFIGGARDEEPLSSFSLVPLGDSRIRLSLASPSIHSLLERCIQRAYPAGLHSFRTVDEHTDEYSLVGMPWSTSGELRVDADRLMLEVDSSLGILEKEGSWMGETYRVVLSGQPWSSSSLSDRSSVISLLCGLFSSLLRLHWLPSSIALSPHGLLFSSPVDQKPRKRVMCAAAVWITNDNEISLTNFPSTVNDLLVSTARQHFVIIRSDRPSATHYRIRATVLSSTVRMHALLTVFLNELSIIGWRPMTSIQLFDNSDSDQVNVIFVLPDESLVRERSETEKNEQCKEKCK